MFAFLVLLASVSFAQTSLPARTRIEGFFGGAWTCNGVTMRDLKEADCQIAPRFQVNYSVVGVKDIEAVFQEIAFQELAKRGHDEAKCLNTFLNLYSPPVADSVLDPRVPRRIMTPSSFMAQQEYRTKALAASRATSDPFNQLAWVKFQEVRESLKKLQELQWNLSNEIKARKTTIDPMDKSAAQWEMRKRIVLAQEELSLVEDGIKLTVGQIPLGGMVNIHQAMLQLAASPQPVAEAEFKNIFMNAVLSLKTGTRAAIKGFDEAMQKDGVYKLDREARLALAEAGGARELVQDLSNQELREKLSCRMRAYYVDGPRTTRILEMLALTAASFGVHAISSVPLRLMANLGIAAATVEQVKYSIADRCDKPIVFAGGTCDGEYWKNATMYESGRAMCAAALVFNVVSSGYEVRRLIPALK